jgi:hypothetical protein
LDNGKLFSSGSPKEMIDLYVNGKELSSKGFDIKILYANNDFIEFETVYNEDILDTNAYEGRFFIKMKDFRGNDMMFYEKILLEGESFLKKIKLDINSLNTGIYSIQVKVWGISVKGKKITLVSPYYPYEIKNNDTNHKYVFAGKITELKS